MATNPAGDGHELSSMDVLAEMMSDAIGPDEPMTEEALAVASLEVYARIENAKKALVTPDYERRGNDTQAMAALLLIQEEAGL